MNGLRFKPTILAAMCASMLSACGGGDGNGASAPAGATPPNNSPALTGKAIDGYLVGAKVCLDVNTNGICDAGEPNGVTNAAGDYSIPFSGDAAGQRLLVQVTPDTRDLSRPEGFRFPAGFTLSAVAGTSTTQHISPLTTMVAAQMEAGMTEAEAIAAVQALLGGPVDPSANYVANGDASTATVAAQIVDKITSLAPNGSADAATVRSVLNAIVANGDVASVTKADVDAQATKPVYSQVDASQILASPLFSFVDAFMITLDGPTQRIEQIVDGQLKTTYQSRDLGGSVWKDHPLDKATSYPEPKVQFVMKPDGNWTSMITPADWRAPVTLSSIGRTLKGTDPVTGIGVTFEERSVDLSNQSTTLAVSGTLFGPDVSIYPALSTSFPAGTSGYLGIKSFAEDYVVLPLGYSNASCEFPYSQTGGCATTYSTRPNLPPYDPTRAPYDPNVPQNDPSLPSPLTSVQQLVGLSLVDSQVLQATVTVQPGGQASVRIDLDPRTSDDDKVFAATWKTYARNPNVLVFDIARSDAQLLTNYGDTAWPLVQGAKFILAIRNGQLQSGLLFPAGYGQRSVQFAKGLPSILTTPVPLESLPH